MKSLDGCHLLQRLFLFGGYMNYDEFLFDKSQLLSGSGFKPTFLPDCLFDFQAAMCEYAIEKGRAALLEDCGMGKTLQFLVWAQNIVEHTNKNVLVLSPLAVASQTINEAEKFGIEAHKSMTGKVAGKITVTNYEKLKHFSWQDYTAVVCDESSRIKNSTAATRMDVTNFMKKIPYRLLCTATAAPNDYLELGTSSEALAYRIFLTNQYICLFTHHHSQAKAEPVFMCTRVTKGICQTMTMIVFSNITVMLLENSRELLCRAGLPEYIAQTYHQATAGKTTT